MPQQILYSFIIFSFVCGITPGPANLASLAASIQFGKVPALRMWTGIFTGFFADIVISCLLVFFFGTALNQYVKWLSVIGIVYLCYLAWHIASAPVAKEGEEQPEVNFKPGFLTGFLLQLTNVKVIFTCITGFSSYVILYTTKLPLMFLWGAPVLLIGPVSNLVWLFTGLSLQRFFTAHARVINIVMGLSILLCAVSLIPVMIKS